MDLYAFTPERSRVIGHRVSANKRSFSWHKPRHQGTSAHEDSEEESGDEDSSDEASVYDESPNEDTLEEDPAYDGPVEGESEDEERGRRSQPAIQITPEDLSQLSIRKRRLQEAYIFLERVHSASSGEILTPLTAFVYTRQIELSTLPV